MKPKLIFVNPNPQRTAPALTRVSIIYRDGTRATYCIERPKGNHDTQSSANRAQFHLLA